MNKDQVKEQVKEQEQVKEMNNIKIIKKLLPWISPTQTMSNTCYKLTMNMIDKQPPKKIPVYKKINKSKLY